MTILSMKERQRPPLKVRDNGTLHGKRTFEFVSDDDNTTLTDILAFAGFPSRGDAHPHHSAALLRTFEPEFIQDDMQNVHILTCRYDSATQFDPDETTPDALIKAGFIAQDRPVPAIFDAYGRPNVNTAGDLIPGLVTLANEFVIPVTAPFATIPTYLLTLNNTLNNSHITFRGITFEAGTLMLKDVEIPDEPDTDPEDATGFWMVTYKIVHNPDGFYELHANRGKHELVYQVRVDTDSDWETTTPADYDLETDATLKQVVKHRIRTDDDQSAGEDVWLDSRGQAQLNPQFSTVQLGLGTMTLRSFNLSLKASPSPEVFPTDDSIIGATVAIVGAGTHGRILLTVIESVTDSKTAVLADLCGTAVTDAVVYLPGVIALRIVNQPLADWSSLPLPNNDPS